MIFEIYISYFWEIIQVLRRRVITFKKKKGFKNLCFCPLTLSCFASLQVLIAKGSYQRGFLANLSLDDCL